MRRAKRSGFPGQFVPREGVLHRLPVSVRMIVATALALAGLFARTPQLAIAVALVCVVLYVAARLGWHELRQDVTVVVLQAPLVIMLFLWRDGLHGLHSALMVSARLAIPALSALWVQRTTRVTAVTSAFSKLLPPRSAFVIAMSLRFLPMLARDAREIYSMQRLRGARIEPRDLVNPAHWAEACHCIAVPLLIRTLRLADQVAIAATQRGVGTAAPGVVSLSDVWQQQASRTNVAKIGVVSNNYERGVS